MSLRGDQGPSGQPGSGQPSWVAPDPWMAPGARVVPAQPAPPDPWTSPLWSRPDTVGGYAPEVAGPPPPPPWQPPPPPPGRRRGPAVLVALVVAALLAGGAVVANMLHSPNGTTAAPPRPSASALPTVPTRPTTPTPAPSSPLPAPSTAPSGPSGIPPGSPGSAAPQQRALTPEQSAAAAAVSPGLVDVNTAIGYDGRQGAGTGMVLSADGLVLTNHHVVAGATSVRVTDVGNGKTYDATVLGYDSTHDVAVLRLEGASGLTVAPMGSSASVKVADPVVAVGNAGGAGGAPVPVAGTVQALDQQITATDEVSGSPRQLSGLIRFDAAIQPGDSGGALVDAHGKVVGMVTAGSTGATAGDTAAMTQGYAVPIDRARSIARQIIAGTPSSTVHIGETGFLGLQVVPGAGAGASSAGVRVADVVAGSAAEKAGITGGDVITSVGGRATTSADALHEALASHQPGDTVRVAWTDTSGQKHTARIRLGSGPVG